MSNPVNAATPRITSLSVRWRQIDRLLYPVMYIKMGGPTRASNVCNNPEDLAMHALRDLFTTDVGLMSIVGIAFMLGMGIFYVRYFLRHMEQDAKRARLEGSRR
jgi:hypothetical protein